MAKCDRNADSTGNTMTSLTISFALWTYNGAKYLPEQLESLTLQHRPPDELVISDDASSDDTVGIIREYARHARFPVRLVVNSENAGPSQNYAQAVRLCSGDIIVPLGQDDIQHPDKLTQIETVFRRWPAVGLCSSDAELIDHCSRPLGETLWQRIRFSPDEQREVAADDIMAVLIRHNVVSGPTCAFRSEYRDVVLPIPSGWWEDYWAAVIIAAMSSVAIIPTCLVKYRLHPDQQLGLPHIPYMYNLVYAQWMADFWSAAIEPLSQHLPAKQLG